MAVIDDTEKVFDFCSSRVVKGQTIVAKRIFVVSDVRCNNLIRIPLGLLHAMLPVGGSGLQTTFLTCSSSYSFLLPVITLFLPAQLFLFPFAGACSLKKFV